MEKNIFLITNKYKIITLSDDSYNILGAIGDKALIIPEETYIAITLSEKKANEIITKLKKERDTIELQKSTIKTI